MDVNLNTVIDLFKRRAGIQDSERFDESDLSSFLLTALSSHNPSYTLDRSGGNLPEREVVPLILLAWSDLQLTRASRFSMQAGTTGAGSGFGVDRNTPYYRCTDLAKLLRTQYEDQCSALGLAMYAGGIMSTEVTVTSLETGEEIPFALSRSIPAPLIVGPSSMEGDSITLSWIRQAPDLTNFGKLVVMYSKGAAIRQPWKSESGGYPEVANTAEELKSIYLQSTTSVRITGMDSTPGTVHHFLLLVVTRSGKVSYSNEHTVTA